MHHFWPARLLCRMVANGKRLPKPFPTCPNPVGSFPTAVILYVPICRICQVGGIERVDQSRLLDHFLVNGRRQNYAQLRDCQHLCSFETCLNLFPNFKMCIELDPREEGARQEEEERGEEEERRRKEEHAG